jgi:hypothetical protein
VEEFRERVRHERRVAGIVESFDQPARDAEPLQHLAQEHRARLGRQALPPSLDSQRPIELCSKARKIFTHDAPPGAGRQCLDTTVLPRASAGASCFSVTEP